VLGLQRANVPG